MYSIKEIVERTAHRSWQLSDKKWSYYQEWNYTLFFHWELPRELLEPLLPAGLTLDLHQGKAWISIVPFTMERIRPRNLPAVALVSNFHEINVRTYVIKDGKPGVYFLNIETSKSLSVWLSRQISGLPYEKSVIERSISKREFSSVFAPRSYAMKLKYDIGQPIVTPNALELFLTERYCLYVTQQKKMYRYEIHHLPWQLYNIEINAEKFNYEVASCALTLDQALKHYSPGVQVVAWGKEYLGEVS